MRVARETADSPIAKRTDIYGDDDAAALRDLLFSWLEERFLHAHAGAPSISRSTTRDLRPRTTPN